MASIELWSGMHATGLQTAGRRNIFKFIIENYMKNSDSYKNLNRDKSSFDEQNLTLEIYLYDHAVVPKKLYAQVKSNIEWHLPYIRHQKNLVEADLVGIGFWSNLSYADKRLVRICVAYLSQNRILPILRHDDQDGSPIRYKVGKHERYDLNILGSEKLCATGTFEM